MYSSQADMNFSQHTVYHTGELIGASDESTEMTVCVHLKSFAMTQTSETENALFYKNPGSRKYLTAAELHAQFSADTNASAALIDYFQSHQLKIANENTTRRTITISGALGDFQQAFGIGFTDYQNEQGQSYRMHNEEPIMPEELKSLISYIEGLHNMPPVRSRADAEAETASKTTAETAFLGYTPLEIAEAYDFPEGDGEGETIGIIELGGAYIPSDMEKYFSDLGMSVPNIQTVGTDKNDSIANDLEVTLDIQVVGALLPKATMVLYYGSSLITAIKEAIYDPNHKPSVLSVSWAGSEFNYSVAELNEMNQLCYQASLMGITIVAASGDQGAYNSKNYLNVSVPSSLPFVLGCGGTRLTIADGQNQEEIIWNELATKRGASGGGFSARFPVPSYQANAVANYHFYKTNSAGVPDIAANADASSGYKTLYNGHYFAEGGTSAATPVWASLLVRLNQNLGCRLGFVNEVLYKYAGTEMFRQVIEGNNGFYQGAPYWNPCTGLGSPKGKAILTALRNLE